jgi:hypothetical protein
MPFIVLLRAIDASIARSKSSYQYRITDFFKKVLDKFKQSFNMIV